jgi:hypothetical protein
MNNVERNSNTVPSFDAEVAEDVDVINNLTGPFNSLLCALVLLHLMYE